MRLAILIVGVQNGGKTTTIKHLISAYNGRTLKVMRAGWKNIFLNPLLKSMRLNFFCVPASPTETKVKLSTRFVTNPPDILVVAEQIGGANFPDTINFLAIHGYHVLRYDILTTSGITVWERSTAANRIAKLDNRVNQIVGDIKLFLKTSGII